MPAHTAESGPAPHRSPAHIGHQLPTSLVKAQQQQQRQRTCSSRLSGLPRHHHQRAMRTPTYLRALGGAAAVAVPLMFSVTTSTASTASSGTSTPPSNSPGKAAAKSGASISPDAQSAHLDSKAQLLLTQVVFRHGARTPLTSYTEFWKDDPTWDVCGTPLPYEPVALSLTSTTGEVNPVSRHNLKQMARKMPGGCFAGELTLLGHKQALDLGQRLRKRYVEELGFLPPSFSPDTVSCRTTNFDRTIKTLGGVLSGLYPDNKTPIPVVTSSDLDEILYADTKQCPHLQTFLDLSKGKGSRSNALRDPDYAWARAELQKVLHLKEEFFNRAWAMTDVHDAMTSMKAHGKKLPAGVSERLLSVVNRLATKEFASIVAPSIDNELGQAVLRLSMGVLLHTMVTNMERVAAIAPPPATAATAATSNAARNSPPAASATDSSNSSNSSNTSNNNASNNSNSGPALYLYSGHDSTIIPLLAALGLQLNEWPPYLSNLVFELWRLADGRLVVRVLYNMQELQIPYCNPGEVPSLEKFKHDVVGPFVLSAQQRGEACQVRLAHDAALPRPMSISSAALDDEGDE